MFNRVFSDPRWLFLFVAIAQAHLITYLYSSYLVLWLNSFVSTGQIENSQQVELLFSRMTLASLPSTIVTILLTGFLADCIKPVLLIAPAFFGRAVTTYMFKFVDEPQTIGAYTLVCALIFFSIIQVISLESLFMKNLPRDARGAMTIIMTFFLDIAALAYNGGAGPIFDSYGPSAPFTIIAIFDVTLCLLAVLLGACGHLTYGSNSSSSQRNDNSLMVEGVPAEKLLGGK